MGLLSFLPKEDQYFDLFTQMTLYICSAARELKEMLADKNRDYKEYAQRIKGHYEPRPSCRYPATAAN